jgi:hypothetical protein
MIRSGTKNVILYWANRIYVDLMQTENLKIDLSKMIRSCGRITVQTNHFEGM